MSRLERDRHPSREHHNHLLSKESRNVGTDFN